MAKRPDYRAGAIQRFDAAIATAAALNRRNATGARARRNRGPGAEARSNECRCVPSDVLCTRPDVDQIRRPDCARVERPGVIRTASGVADVTLTRTSIPRWSEGNPMKVPWSGVA